MAGNWSLPGAAATGWVTCVFCPEEDSFTGAALPPAPAT